MLPGGPEVAAVAPEFDDELLPPKKPPVGCEGWNVAFERLRLGGAIRPGWAEEGLDAGVAGPGRIVALLRESDGTPVPP